MSSGSQGQLAVHRVSKEQMSCWGEQLRVDGGRIAEVEYEHAVAGEWIGGVVEAGQRWCCRLGPLWITELRCCKEAKT